MPSWWDSLFGDVPPRPARPRAALCWARAIKACRMPRPLRTGDQKEIDYTVGMRRSRGDAPDYWPTDIKGADPWGAGIFPGGYDPLVAAPLIALAGTAQRARRLCAFVPAKFTAAPQAVLTEWPTPSSSSDPDLPYLGAHLPWSPGDPGWTPPPPPTVLPTRPGARGLTLNSSPWGM